MYKQEFLLGDGTVWARPGTISLWIFYGVCIRKTGGKFPEELIFTTPNLSCVFSSSIVLLSLRVCVCVCMCVCVCVCVWSSSKTSSTALNCIDPLPCRIVRSRLLEGKLFVVSLLYNSLTVCSMPAQLNDLRCGITRYKIVSCGTGISVFYWTVDHNTRKNWQK
jgi:hypothetical protein